MCAASYGLLSKIVGELLLGPEQFESALLVPELAAGRTSLSQSTASLDSAPRPSVGRVRFELDLPPPLAVGIVLWGGAVLMGAWAAVEVPAPASGSALYA